MASALPIRTTVMKPVLELTGVTLTLSLHEARMIAVLIGNLSQNSSKDGTHNYMDTGNLYTVMINALGVSSVKDLPAPYASINAYTLNYTR